MQERLCLQYLVPNCLPPPASHSLLFQELLWAPDWPGQLWWCRGERRGGWRERWGGSRVWGGGNKYPGSRHTLNKVIVTKMTIPSYFIFSPDFSVSWLGRISKVFPFIFFILVMETSVNGGARNKTDSYDSLWCRLIAEHTDWRCFSTFQQPFNPSLTEFVSVCRVISGYIGTIQIIHNK